VNARSRGAQERTRLEAELRRARNEVLRLARAAAVGELTTSMARAMARPLRAILHDAQAAQRLVAQAAQQLVAAAPPHLDRAVEALRDIEAHAGRASEVVHEVLRAVGRGTSDRRTLHLEALVGDVVRLLAPEADARGVSVAVDAAPDLPPVTADPSELRAMLAHVLGRALEAAAVGRRGRGDVAVRLRAIEGGSVRLEVRDTGPRIAPEAVAFAFEPLLAMGARGTGAGLALCRAICEAHGGSLALASEADGRSVLAVTLPGTQRPASRRAERAS
jgi:two-component system, LuxR family, sensor kinase FixL